MKRIWIILFLASLFGCSNNPSTDTYDEIDPFESFNRAIFDFNTSADEYVIQPIAEGYQAITPDYLEDRVSDFFGNIADFKTLFNQALQGKIVDAAGSFGRVLLNSTVGIFGLFDVASDMDIPRKKEDFGQTLATWGFDSGPYLVLPILGPSSIRDATGFVGDSWHRVDLISHIPDESDQLATRAVGLIDTRVSVDDLLNITYRKNDPYLFARDGFFQNRNFEINDGEIEQSLDDDF